ncbi:excinuclease ABC subunit UvrC [Mycoplasmatota bacterium]|nr:excinuclease ABC subunit UvrC [Mycoplasmatota bacterium]
MRVENFTDKLQVIPEVPGCYLYRDKRNTVIYVGKSKNLRKRVNSYFKGAHDLKTTLLVSEIYDLEFVITKTELEALVLELNLIKRHSPKFNIKLNDDATYPYIQITNEVHPRLIVTRNPKKKHGKVYGPFPNSFSANETVKLLNKIYSLRNCVKLPKRECLYYHMGQCLAPCIKTVDTNLYISLKEEIYKFLNGDTKSVINKLKDKMNGASENLEYEKAKEYRDLISHIEKTVEKQQISLNDFTDRDIFGYHIKENMLCLSIFFMRQGKIVARDISITDFYEDEVDAINSYIAQYYTNYNHPKPKEILVQFDETSSLSELLGIKVITPKIGNKKKILEMAINNAEVMMEQQELLFKRKQDRTINACKELAEILELDHVSIIEAFDNSNLMGVDSVSAMVTYIDGRPIKNLYRKYRVKTVDGPDDYATMREVIYRRYLKVITDDLQKPDLVIVDGGKGQLRAAKEVLDTLNLELNIIGLKKDKNHNTSSVINSEYEEVKLNKKSNSYKLLNAIQEEVHRYAINYHRQRRTKNAFSSILDDIDGIGPKRRRLLFKKFSSISELKDCSIQDLINIGLSRQLSEKILIKLNSSTE